MQRQQQQQKRWVAVSLLPLQSIHITECSLELRAEMSCMFKCGVARERVTDRCIYKKRTCTSSLRAWGFCSWGCKQHKQMHRETQRAAAPYLEMHPTFLSHSAIPWISIYVFLCVLRFAGVRVGVCVWACVWVSGWVVERERERDAWYLSACCTGQTACLPDERWLANLGKNSWLPWDQSFTNLRINSSRMDKQKQKKHSHKLSHTHTHTRIHTEKYLKPHWSMRRWLRFVYLLTISSPACCFLFSVSTACLYSLACFYLPNFTLLFHSVQLYYKLLMCATFHAWLSHCVYPIQSPPSDHSLSMMSGACLLFYFIYLFYYSFKTLKVK